MAVEHPELYNPQMCLDAALEAPPVACVIDRLTKTTLASDAGGAYVITGRIVDASDPNNNQSVLFHTSDHIFICHQNRLYHVVPVGPRLQFELVGAAFSFIADDRTDQLHVRRIYNCDDCGACCMQVSRPPFTGLEALKLPDELQAEIAAGYERKATKPCSWYDPGTKGCKHYEHRPQSCRDFEIGSKDCEHYRKLYNLSIPPNPITQMFP